MYMYLIYEDGCWSLFADVLIENVRTINLPVLSIRFCKIISNSDIFVIHVHVAITNKRTLNVWYVYHIRVCLKCAWNGHISMIMSIFYKQTPPPKFRNKCQEASLSKSLVTYSFGRTTLYFPYIDKYNAESIFYSNCWYCIYKCGFNS